MPSQLLRALRTTFLRNKLNSLCRRMSDKTHIERTVQNTRSQVESEAVVRSIENISPTVKKLRLQVQNPVLTFKAGQWVDFCIPSVETIGGYSMCASPSLLHTERVLDLAVKFSHHPPAHWVHTQCQVGSEVAIRVGGDFHYDVTASANQNKDLLLIGGGVGINPLLSILQEIAHTKADANVTLLYSSQTREEMIFQPEISAICAENDNTTCQYYVTRQPQDSPSTFQCTYGRIKAEDIQRSLQRFHTKDNVLCYLCGPGPMIDCMQGLLIDCGLRTENIVFEKWW